MITRTAATASKSILLPSLEFRLHRATHDAVRSYLCRKHPQLFYYPLLSSHDRLVTKLGMNGGSLFEPPVVNPKHSSNGGIGAGSATVVDSRPGFNDTAVCMASHYNDTHSAMRDEDYTALLPSASLSSSRRSLPLHRVIDELATINGFQKTTIENDNVALAEGVVASQNPRWMKNHIVYSRPTHSPVESDHSILLLKPATTANTTVANNNHKSLSNRKAIPSFHPPFFQEDFTLYRILENRLETFLNRKKEHWKEILDNNPVTNAIGIIQKQLLTNNNNIKNLWKDSAKQQLTERDNMENQNLEEIKKSTHIDDGSNSSSTTTEDLLVISQHAKIVLYEHISPSFRLLALPPILTYSTSINGKKTLVPRMPYRLQHNGASTILYASFVTFGAIPLAYRSIRYAMDYPAMVEMLTASFIGTFAYSLWYSRKAARTRQRLCVEKAIGSRVVARESAVIGTLVDGAVDVVTEAVLKEYFDALRGKKRRLNGADSDEIMAVEHLVDMELHPVKIAEELGLLVSSSNNEKDEFTAIGLDEAVKALQKTN